VREVIAIALASLLVMSGTPARADQRQAAEHFALAESAEKRGDWKTAIDEYSRAYALAPHPSVLYNIARSHEHLEDWAQAAEYFRRYLAEDPAAADRAEVEQRIALLEEKARAARPAPRTGTGWLIVHAQPDGAEVLVDGQPVGVTPLNREVPAGTHKVLVRAPGYHPIERDVTVEATGSEQIRATLVATGEKPPEPTEPRRSLQFVVGGEYGWGFGEHTQYRVAGVVGLRLLEIFEVDLLVGALSSEVIYGVENRTYVGRGPNRLYLRAAFTKGTFSGSDSLDATGIEGGLGYVFSGRGAAVGRWGLYSQLSLRAAFYGSDPDLTSPDPADETRYTVVVAGGIILN
jgi:hypothetical protein